MAARPQVKKLSTPPPADTVIENQPAPDMPESDLQAMMAELAGSSSSSVTVYRSNKGQQLAYVFKCTPDAFSLDTLRDKYNGGEFRLFITKEGVLWKNKTVYVEPKQASSGEAPPTQAAEMAAAMREGFAKQAELMANVVRTLAAPAPAPAASLFSNIDIPAAITAVSALLATLRPPPAAVVTQPANPNQAIDMLMKGFELARELKSGASEGEGEPSLMGLMRDLIKSPMLGQAIAATVQAQQPQQPQRIAPPRTAVPQVPQAQQVNAPPVPTPQPPTSFASETPSTGTDPMLAYYLKLLCAKAAEDADPALYADLVLDNMDGDMLDQLLARQPSPVDGLISDYPPVAEHRAWFEQLVAIIQGALAPEAPPVAQLGSNDGPNNHASGHTTPAIPGGTSAG